MSDTSYDLIIAGAGPAGLMAQVYALRYNLKVLAIGGIVGGLMTESHKICNWPGEPSIVGLDLSRRMHEQVKSLGGEVLIDEVAELKREDNGWTVTTKNQKTFKAKAVLLATGTEHRHLGLENEADFVGRGLAYCATCDAMFYRGLNVAVAGGGNSAMTAALYLADICPKVYLIYRGEELKGEIAWVNEVMAKDNIIKMKKTNIVKLVGENKLSGLVLDQPFDGQNELAVSGLFVEVGTTPKTDLFIAAGGQVDEWGRVPVKADQGTAVAGLWAAGDITNGSNGLRQMITACAEGAVAADSIFKYLRTVK